MKMRKKDSSNNKIIGFRLAMVRIFHELSQAEFAEKIGCSQRYISQIEKGKTNVSAKFLFKTINLFNLPESYFNPDREGPEIYIKKSEKPENSLCHI